MKLVCIMLLLASITSVSATEDYNSLKVVNQKVMDSFAKTIVESFYDKVNLYNKNRKNPDYFKNKFKNEDDRKMFQHLLMKSNRTELPPSKIVNGGMRIYAGPYVVEISPSLLLKKKILINGKTFKFKNESLKVTIKKLEKFIRNNIAINIEHDFNLIDIFISKAHAGGTLENQIFWAVTGIIASEGGFLNLPLYCLTDSCRTERQFIANQNLEKVFHEVRKQESECRDSIDNGYSWSQEETAKLIRKIAAFDQKEEEITKVKSIINSKFSKSKYWDMSCENIIRSVQRIEDPIPYDQSNEAIRARNKKIVEQLKPMYCKSYNALKGCLVEMKQKKTSIYNKVKRYAKEIPADDGVREIDISTLDVAQ